MVADDPATRIELKTFHGEIRNDHQRIKLEKLSYEGIPPPRAASQPEIAMNYPKIKADIKVTVETLIIKNP